jgi:hypothetical protein
VNTAISSPFVGFSSSGLLYALLLYLNFNHSIECTHFTSVNERIHLVSLAVLTSHQPSLLYANSLLGLSKRSNIVALIMHSFVKYMLCCVLK